MTTSIPSELRDLKQWVCWRYETRDGKATKVPYQPSGKLARVNNPDTFSSFETVSGVEGFDGIGFVLTADDPYCGIDLDHCIDSGVTSETAAAVLNSFDSYTETTPSGNGLRVWIRAQLPAKGRKTKLGDGEIEIYDRNRFLTVTGNAVDLYPEEINDRQSELDTLLAELFPATPEVAAPADPLSLDDQSIVDKMFASKHGDEIRSLWHGNISKYGDDDSSADFALAWQIGFYTRDIGQIERIMRTSCLARDKWDKHRTYLSRTITRALESKTESYTPPAQPLDQEPETPAGKPGKAEAQTEWLIRRILDGAEGSVSLFESPDLTTYIRLTRDSHTCTWPIKSTGFRQFLRQRFYAARAKALREEDLKRVVDLLDAQAAYDGQTQQAYLRVAPGDDNDIYIDLRNDDWQVIHVTAAGWKIVDDSPILFRRGRNSLALPTPARDGNLDILRTYLNVDDDQWVLLCSCLVSYFSPFGPYPVLSISGEQGSGKSTACRIIKRLVDPAAAELYSMPEQRRDVLVSAQNNWLIAYENLSSIPPWLSDVLCVLSTGGGFSSRELYTDLEERVMNAQRPVITNGIPDIVTRPDLLGRAIPLTLAPITNYQTESAFRRALDADLPAALGGLLDAVAAGLANLETTITDASARMADFARWAAAAAPALGWEPARFLSVYAENRETAQDTILEMSQVAMAIQAFAGVHDAWEGTTSELFDAISPSTLPRDWPKNARSLSATIRRYAPVLRTQGVDIRMRKSGSHRLLQITRDANPMPFASLQGTFASLPDEFASHPLSSDGTQKTQGTQVPASSPLCQTHEERENIDNKEEGANFASLASLTPDSDDCDWVEI